MYNYELREMTNEDWDDEIKYMADAGIRTAILQTVFDVRAALFCVGNDIERQRICNRNNSNVRKLLRLFERFCLAV